MKKLLSILTITALLCCAFIFEATAKKPTPPTTAETPAAKAELNEAGNPIEFVLTPDAPADTVGQVVDIDGERFIVVASEVDETTGQIKTIVKAYEENKESGGSLLQFLITLVASGALGTLLTQLTKTSKSIVSFVNGIERPVRVAFFISGAIAAGWIYLDTKFVGLNAVAVATKWLLVFAPTLLAYEFVGRFFVKKPAVPAA